MAGVVFPDRADHPFTTKDAHREVRNGKRIEDEGANPELRQ
jgi:hypothetical protein